MTITSFLEQNHDISSCFRLRIQELAEQCDHEYYMSALPYMINKQRAMRGYSRIIAAVEEFKQLLEFTECKPCREQIANQLLLQDGSLREIKAVWNL